MPDATPERDALVDLKAEIHLWEGDGSSPVDLNVLRRAAAEIARLRAEVAEFRARPPPTPRDARIAELEAALREAIDDIQAWGAGPALLNGNKDILAADIAKHRRTLGDGHG